ncbi:alpha/beta hydrolase family protein [Leifsonia sp. SIMBA_070]|uniref:alpha/beta hydrolase family protein n=1 Tax=Leifsonia sp. SIMBA_070 TaxID=3085810 RepID=UPI003978DF28
MTWILIIAAAVLAVAAAAWAARCVGRRLALAVVRPRARPVTRIHGCTATSVTLEADRRTLHRGQFGLWFGDGGHAVVGHTRAHDPAAGTVTRELLEVTGDLEAVDAGYWTGHLHAGPAALRRPFREVVIDVPGGAAPAWLIPAGAPGRRATWAVHIHGWASTRVTALRSVPATEAAGMTSLVVSYRGDGEGPPAAGGASLLGLREWEDVDAAIGYAVDHGAQRVVLVGWSLGGGIALQLSERSAHRAVLDRLVLIGPASDWRAVIRQGATERGLPSWTGGLVVRTLADPVRSARLGLPEPIDFDRLDWTRPGRLTLPTLVIHSEGDRTVPLSSSLLFAMANPRLVRLEELSPAEHSWEYNLDPAAFNRAVMEFLEGDPHLG